MSAVDTVELSMSKRQFDALVHMLERTKPRTDDEMFVYEMLMGEDEKDEDLDEEND